MSLATLSFTCKRSHWQVGLFFFVSKLRYNLAANISIHVSLCPFARTRGSSSHASCWMSRSVRRRRWPQCVMWCRLIMLHSVQTKPSTALIWSLSHPSANKESHMTPRSHSLVQGGLEFTSCNGTVALSNTLFLMARHHIMKGWSTQHSGGRCSFTLLLSSDTMASILPHGFPVVFILHDSTCCVCEPGMNRPFPSFCANHWSTLNQLLFLTRVISLSMVLIPTVNC